jgi:thiosulfate/3-mercaptopyruvate sulfurtransferase
LVDARTPQEFSGEQVRGARGGHIPGAVNVEWSKAMKPDGTFRSVAELERLFQRAGVTRDTPVITYCQTGVRGSHTWFVLKHLLGLPNVTLYEGSWEEWSSRTDLPVSVDIVIPQVTPTKIPDPCD